MADMSQVAGVVALFVLLIVHQSLGMPPLCFVHKRVFKNRDCYTDCIGNFCQNLRETIEDKCGLHLCSQGDSPAEQCFSDTRRCPIGFQEADMAICGKGAECCFTTATTCEQLATVFTGRALIQHQAGFVTFCDNGWTVVQWRTSGKENFDRILTEYETGFGSRKDGYWLGLLKVRELLQVGPYEIRFEFKFQDGSPHHVQYNSFDIGPSADGYILTLSGDDRDASSTIDGLDIERSSGSAFTTSDVDRDTCFLCNCAVPGKGGWWYRDCGNTNLNGIWNFGLFNWGPTWESASGVNTQLSFTAIKIRPAQGS